MNRHRCLALGLLLLSVPWTRAATMPAVGEALEPYIETNEIAGAVTAIVTPDQVVHRGAQGYANLEHKTPMTDDTLFWIASMTKPVTGVAVLMLQDEGKLSVDDAASKYLPELGAMKMKDGSTAATITIKHLLTHTAGLPENSREETRAAKTLQDLVTAFAAKPMHAEPGSTWEYSQTAINALARIVEVVSGQVFSEFLDERMFRPLGMTDTTFYLTGDQVKRLATSYRAADGKLDPTDLLIFAPRDLARRDRVPLANGGLFSTAGDYATFVQMLLNEGSLGGKQYLKPQTVRQMRTLHTGALKTGFTPGNGWGLGVCVVGHPQGASAALSPGSYGHGGAYGTQAWIDPVRKVGYVLMVQRANFHNSDDNEVRKAFQDAAAAATLSSP